MSAWSLYVCFRAFPRTSSAPAACCQLRTMCALPGTEGRVVQIMVSRHWCWNVLVDKGLVAPSLLIAYVCFSSTTCLEPPTPHYNTWVLQDTTLEAHMHLLSNVLGSAQGLKDGVALLKVWLRQRELDKVSWRWPSFLALLCDGLLLSPVQSRLSFRAWVDLTDSLSPCWLPSLCLNERSIPP